MKKRLITMLMAAAMTFALAACGNAAVNSDQGNSDSAAAPKTGDGQNLMVWVLIALGACMGTAALVKVERKKQRN